jgi:glucokinase
MGCFEAKASGASLGRKAGSQWAADGGRGGNARELIAAAMAGDAVALSLVEEGVSYLGMGVANLISTLNPAMVVLGGGLFQSGEWLLDLVRKQAMRWAQPFAAKRARIELSALGDGAGLCGAARIALDNS